MEVDKSEECNASSGAVRTRRRIFTKSNDTSKQKKNLGGRNLLLQDSDEEDDPISRRSSLMADEHATRAAETITFQDIMSSLQIDRAAAEEEEVERLDHLPNGDHLPAISLSSPGSYLESDQDSRRSRNSREMSNSRSKLKALPHLPETDLSESSLGGYRRHSVASSVSTRRSMRKSLESLHTTPAFTGSATSLVDSNGLEPDELEMLKLLRRRQAILRELVTTEISFSDDLAVVVQEYQQNAQLCRELSEEDTRMIFGGVGPVRAFSSDFATELQAAASPVLYSTTTSLPVLLHEDSQTSVGAVFGQSMDRLSKVFSRYCSNHEKAAACLLKASKEPAVQAWLESQHPADRTTAWDLPSLLIKPIQRILKYPLLLSSLLEATPKAHPDYYAIEFAIKEMLLTAESINNIKKRRDIVGSLSAERRRGDLGGIAKTFQRRTTKLKQTVGLEEESDTTDVLYDGLAFAFRAQQVVLQTLRSEVQDWLLAMRASLEYHAKFAAALQGVADCEDSFESSYVPAMDWLSYGAAISDLQQGALVELSHNLEREVFQPISSLESTYLRPALVIAKRDMKSDDFHRVRTSQQKRLPVEQSLADSADQFTQLNLSLVQDLPVFLSITRRAMDTITASLAHVQKGWYYAWTMRLGTLLESSYDPFSIIEQFKDRQAVLQIHLSELDLLSGSIGIAKGEENGHRRISSLDNATSASPDNTHATKNPFPARPSMRMRALSAANNATVSLKQMSLRTSISGSTIPTTRSPRHSYQ